MVTVLNPKEYKEQPVPEVGKEYHTFDDGKVKPSRHSIVTITDVVPFNEFRDSTIVSAWGHEVQNCYWLYAEETDYFVVGKYDDEEEPDYFVRTKDGGCWWCMEMTPYQCHMCSDETWIRGLINPYGKPAGHVRLTRQEAATFIEEYKQRIHTGESKTDEEV